MTSAATPTPVAARLPGLDLARLLAIIGMVLVHASTDLTAHPTASAAPWLEAIQALATNRARLLFFLLAGVGVALLVQRKNVSAGVLIRRALFLTVLGAALAVAGWSDLILVFYGILFLAAILLVKLNNRLLLILAPLVAAPGLLRLVANPNADDTLTNVLLVVGEMVPLFCIGLLIGRADLTSRTIRRTVATAGTLLAVPGLAVLAYTGGLDVAQVEGRVEPIVALVSTTGLCLLTLAACLCLSSGHVGKWKPFVTAGGMPLTGYVGHALLFPLLARVTDLTLGQATLISAAYFAAFVVAATLWRSRYGSGPVEALMRRISGPRPITPLEATSATA